MKKELEELLKLSGTKEFDIELSKLYEKYKDRHGFKEEVTSFLKSRLVVTKSNLDKIENDISIKEKLSEVSQILSLSYIAENYFGKTRNWLYQRINGNIVNGKKSEFSSDELKKFQKALKEISKKIGSLSIG